MLNSINRSDDQRRSGDRPDSSMRQEFGIIMATAEDDFRKWFVESLAPLRSNGDAGFVFAMVAFPLLERYLRNKSQENFNERLSCGLNGLMSGLGGFLISGRPLIVTSKERAISGAARSIENLLPACHETFSFR